MLSTQERQRLRYIYLIGHEMSRLICPASVFAQVRLKEYGSELIEIADNGGGVDPANHQSLTLKYHTSKLQQFSDLQVSSCSHATTDLCSEATDVTPMSAFAEIQGFCDQTADAQRACVLLSGSQHIWVQRGSPQLSMCAGRHLHHHSHS